MIPVPQQGGRAGPAPLLWAPLRPCGRGRRGQRPRPELWGLSMALPCPGSAAAGHRAQGTQEQLPDGSRRHSILNGHCPVARLVRQNAAICLPAPTNPLRSPDTHKQTLFPSNLQSRKASASGMTPGMKPGLSGVLLDAQESENRSGCQFIYALLFLFLWVLMISWFGFRGSDEWWGYNSSSPKMQNIGQN